MKTYNKSGNYADPPSGLWHDIKCFGLGFTLAIPICTLMVRHSPRFEPDPTTQPATQPTTLPALEVSDDAK